MFTTFIAQMMRHKIANILVYLTQKCQNTDVIDYNNPKASIIGGFCFPSR